MNYQVFRIDDLIDRIIPFFEANPLRTAKAENFEKFAQICRMMRNGAAIA